MSDDYHDYGKANSQEDVDRLVERNITIVKELRNKVSEDQFLIIIATVFVQSKFQELQLLDYEKSIKEYEFALGLFAGKAKTNHSEIQAIMKHWLDNYKDEKIELLLKGVELSRKSLAKKAVKAKLAIDPKQKEKTFVKECWDDWRKHPSRYKSKASFARDMLSKVDKLESQKKIEDWCREWEKEQQDAS